MGKITLIADDAASRALHLDSCPLPDNYMADYTITGLLVSHYQKSVEILEAEGFILNHQAFATEVAINSPGEVQAIRSRLAKDAITSEFSDIADSIYQA